MKRLFYISFILISLFCSCKNNVDYLEYALISAGRNRPQLEQVLEHYKDDPEKLAAAKFLIENMPAHYSYQGEDINRYYELAYKIITSNLTPKEQRDSLLSISEKHFLGLEHRTIPDVKVITSDFLIHNIDDAFEKWKTFEWASHLTFDDFCEWLLPYKAVELQNLDSWRDTLSNYFGDAITNMVVDDDQYGTTYYTLDAVRNNIISKVKPLGMYNNSGYPLLSADLLHKQTFGRCEDYVNLAVLTYRSVGLPAVIDETPYWGRYRAGHTWYTMLSDRGEELHAEWDVGSVPGWSFFHDKRIPKVYRRKYAINRERVVYKNESAYKYPFDLCQHDITDKYFRTTDIEIELFKDVTIVEDYAYIATFNGKNIDWAIVDYGSIKKGVAKFNKMGRNVLYLALVYDGNQLVPASKPFVITKTGEIRYIDLDWHTKETVTLKRKYYESNNVAKMRNRILGGKIQCSDNPQFKNATTVYEITSTDIPDIITLETTKKNRYWRYLSSDGTYGSIAELSFFTNDTTDIKGNYIYCSNATSAEASKAFDGDRLTNFETTVENDNWVGMDFGKPTEISYIRIVPRSDENDILPGDEYELKYWDGVGGWISAGTTIATDNRLQYNDIPKGALMWLSNHTRGWDERPFVILDNGNIEWW